MKVKEGKSVEARDGGGELRDPISTLYACRAIIFDKYNVRAIVTWLCSGAVFQEMARMKLVDPSARREPGRELNDTDPDDLNPVAQP